MLIRLFHSNHESGLAVWDGSLKLVTVKLPERLIADVDQLVKAGIYHNRSDAIRAAVRELLRRELWQSNRG